MLQDLVVASKNGLVFFFFLLQEVFCFLCCILGAFLLQILFFNKPLQFMKRSFIRLLVRLVSSIFQIFSIPRKVCVTVSWIRFVNYIGWRQLKSSGPDKHKQIAAANHFPYWKLTVVKKENNIGIDLAIYDQVQFEESEAICFILLFLDNEVDRKKKHCFHI